MVSDSTTGSQDQKQVKPLKFCEKFYFILEFSILCKWFDMPSLKKFNSQALFFKKTIRGGTPLK